MIAVGTLVEGGLDPATAFKVADPLLAACARFEINTPARQAAFVAQCAVESRDFTRLVESMTYTTAARIREVFPSKVKTQAQAQALVRNAVALANIVYAGINGNRPDSLLGDGWLYRGRGLIQLTGRANYQQAADDCGRPYVDSPDLVSEIPDACLSSASYWKRRGCNELADVGDWDAITRRVNGPAMLEKDTRRARTLGFVRAFS